ncbi:MAG: hypothetical protein ACLFNC_00820 [Halodesulfurarchaeum sp.]
MRRIYESEAIRRDDEDPFSPNERRDRSTTPISMRLFPSKAIGRAFVPLWLRNRAISVDIRTPRDTYPLGTEVPFLVSMKNSLPVPITIPTRSAVLWTWDVDDVTEASHVRRDPPTDNRGFTFERGERKTFRKRWFQTFRVAESEWEPATAGTYTIGAGINVENAAEKGLYSQTTVRLLEETAGQG